VAKFSYTTGDGYVTRGVPNVSVTDNVARLALLTKKHKSVAAASGATEGAGVNQLDLTIGGVPVYSAELGSNLNISGGIQWSYDGVTPVENNFLLYPENLDGAATTGRLDGCANLQIFCYLCFGLIIKETQ